MKQTQRLDKILSHMGYGSRSEIRNLVKQRKVLVNGQPVKDSGIQVNPSADQLEVDQQVVVYREFVYLMLNKPQGVVSATEDRRDRTVIDLLDGAYSSFELFPVGRLDKDTEGLLLLTNDGKLAHDLLSPRKHVPKTYYADIDGQVGELEQELFRAGVTLEDGYKTLPAILQICTSGDDASQQPAAILLTIEEGKFHQVKRMFMAVGKKVLFLKRISMGSLQLDKSLQPGQYRELAAEEVNQLRGAEV